MKITNIIAIVLMTCCCQVSAKDTIERKHLGDWEKDLGYTQTVKVGNTLYLSGITSGAATMADQINEIYTLITKILAEYNLTTAAIIKETVYTTDIDALKINAGHRKQFFKNNHYPAATWVQVERLIVPELLLEVEIIA